MIAMTDMQYFDKPTQVVFADPDNEGEWIVGIAYKDEIICGCCGGIFDIGDVVDMAAEAGIKHPIYAYSDWNDIAAEITGGELPEGLERNDDYEIYETEADDYEQYAFNLEEEEEVAVFANTWVDGVAMPSID
jgi:hypothetical protein